MNFSELRDAVYAITARPDLSNEVTHALLASTLKLHCANYWYRDLSSALLVNNTAATVQRFDLSDLPRYRALAYVRKYDPAAISVDNYDYLYPLPRDRDGGGLPGVSTTLAMISIIAPDDIFDQFGRERTDVAYVAGTSLNVRSSTAFNRVNIGWYERPNIGTAAANYTDYSSWIADEYPYAIVHDAVVTVLTSAGRAEEGNRYASLAVQQYEVLKLNNTTAVGF